MVAIVVCIDAATLVAIVVIVVVVVVVVVANCRHCNCIRMLLADEVNVELQLTVAVDAARRTKPLGVAHMVALVAVGGGGGGGAVVATAR